MSDEDTTPKLTPAERRMDMLLRLGACDEAREWVLEQGNTSDQRLWDTCPETTWMDWLADQCNLYTPDATKKLVDLVLQHLATLPWRGDYGDLARRLEAQRTAGTLDGDELYHLYVRHYASDFRVLLFWYRAWLDPYMGPGFFETTHRLLDNHPSTPINMADIYRTAYPKPPTRKDMLHQIKLREMSRHMAQQRTAR